MLKGDYMSDMTMTIIIAVLSVIVCIDNALSFIPSIKSNSFLQLVFEIVQKIRDSLSKGN